MIAVAGSGPAGLTNGLNLSALGYQVTVFEALHEIGGVLKYGIPGFRLPNEIINLEIDNLRKMGIHFETNYIVGKTESFHELKKQGYQAFFIGSGAGLPNFMNIPGENLVGIFSSNEYLTRVNLMGASKPEYDTPVLSGKKVAVIGGGNTAMDSVRTALRLGAEKAMIIYRRTMDEMPARKEEMKHALEEGVEIITLQNPVAYIGNDKSRVRQIRFKNDPWRTRCIGTAETGTGRNSEYLMDVDTVIVSVGVSPSPIIPLALPEIEMTRWGTIKVNPDNMQSSVPMDFCRWRYRFAAGQP